MPEVVVHRPTWLDKHFRKALHKLNQKEQSRRLDQIAELMAALRDCRHPTLDPDLQRWRPSAYRGVPGIRGGGRVVEYRFPGLLRVVAAYFEDEEVGVRIVMVAATLKHDHERIVRLLKEHRAEIAVKGG